MWGSSLNEHLVDQNLDDQIAYQETARNEALVERIHFSDIQFSYRSTGMLRRLQPQEDRPQDNSNAKQCAHTTPTCSFQRLSEV